MGSRHTARIVCLSLLTLASTVLAAAGGHGNCGTCHGLTGTSPATGRPSRPDARLCTTCHGLGSFAGHGRAIAADDLDPRPGHYWPEAKRGAADLDGVPVEAHCLACHDPHADDAPFLREPDRSDRSGSTPALDPISALCVRCHASAGAWGGWFEARKHPVGVPVAEGLPATGDTGLPVRRVDVHGTPDAADDVVSCVTCHTVHERREVDLLAWVGADERTAACLTCHRLEGVPPAEEWLDARRRHRSRETLASLSAP